MDRKDNNGSRASAAASIYKSLLEQGYQAWFSQAGARGVTIVWAKKTHPVLFARHRQTVLIMLDFCQQPNIFSWKYTFLPVLEELVYCQRFLSHVHSAIFIGFLLFRAKSPPFDFFSSANITNPTYVMRQLHIQNIPNDWYTRQNNFVSRNQNSKEKTSILRP